MIGDIAPVSVGQLAGSQGRLARREIRVQEIA
jgi:hypothetical protein